MILPINPGEYRPDLSYYASDTQEILTVGYIHPKHQFSSGKVPRGVLDKLKALLLSSARTDTERSICACYFCDMQKEITTEISGNTYYLSRGYEEIWIPAGHKIFASPHMMVHSIEEHDYYPPEAYLDALIEFDIDSDWQTPLAGIAITAKHLPTPELMDLYIRIGVFFQMRGRGIVTQYSKEEITSTYFYKKYPAAQEILEKINRYQQQFY